MKKLRLLSLLGFMFCVTNAWALDPVAPVSERKFGVVYVQSTLPGSDIITLTSSTDPGKVINMKSGVDAKVPVGDYQVRIEMQDYSYEVGVTVRPTERHEIIVPGYGNLKVNGPKAVVEVFEKDSKKPIAKFDTNYVKTLPKGIYDVKITYGKTKKQSIDEHDVSIVTNTTRQIDFNF